MRRIQVLITAMVLTASLAAAPSGFVHAAATTVTQVRSVTRNDADTPFVRTVLDTSRAVKPTYRIEDNGKTLIVTLPQTLAKSDVDTKHAINKNVISKIDISNFRGSTIVRIRVPQRISEKDVKVFTLPGNARQKINNRVVIDVNDKSGKVKQWSHWHDSQDSISKPFSESIDKDFKGGKRFVGNGKAAMIWPVYGVITSPFGYRVHPIYGRQILHSGMDIGVDYGTPVHAALDGVVIEAEWISGYGNAVVIDHGNNTTTLYGHNQKLNVKVGQQVKQGDVIAYAGSTGNSTGPHVHFEIRVNGEAVDPALYL